ncbi:MAG TPA: Hsp20/alpha crystallin family protein [Anaerolineae bacterium]|nr:Hsp20/alpha crystallin family protein [Anaerolineae bacterium]
MAGLIRWDPFRRRELMSLRDAMDRMFEEGMLRPPMPFGWGEESLAVDMYETDDNVVVKTAIPGVKADDIEVSVTGDTLSVRAETKQEEEVNEERYLRRERRYGSYCRQITLPGGIQADQAEADYSDGVLTLTFPKAEEVKPRSIRVQSRQQEGQQESFDVDTQQQ